MLCVQQRVGKSRRLYFPTMITPDLMDASMEMVSPWDREKSSPHILILD
jgi:hypothetical protein